MKPETLGEVNIMFANLISKFEDLSKKVDENTKISQATLDQAIKTNGRVNIIEPLAFDYRERRAQAKGAVTMWVMLGTVVVSSGGFLGTMYLEKVQREITDGVVSTLESKYNIEYEENNTQIVKKK
jgi:hypothetical protein